jgi:hypothetical protein
MNSLFKYSQNSSAAAAVQSEEQGARSDITGHTNCFVNITICVC